MKDDMLGMVTVEGIIIIRGSIVTDNARVLGPCDLASAQMLGMSRSSHIRYPCSGLDVVVSILTCASEGCFDKPKIRSFV